MAELAPARVRVLLVRARVRIEGGGTPGRGLDFEVRPRRGWASVVSGWRGSTLIFPRRPQRPALSRTVPSASAVAPASSRETSPRLVSCSWICYRPDLFPSRPKRARFLAGEEARMGNSGSPSLPANLPRVPGPQDSASL